MGDETKARMDEAGCEEELTHLYKGGNVIIGRVRARECQRVGLTSYTVRLCMIRSFRVRVFMTVRANG